MADKQTPATDQPAYANDPNNRHTISINGQVFTILDVGYIFGNSAACMVLSDNYIFVNPIPDGFNVCPACVHPEGTSIVPDWEICGTPSGGHGLLIKLKAPWMCHCLKTVGYVSVDTTPIEQNTKFAPMCGASQIPPLALGAGLAIAALGAGLLAMELASSGGSSNSNIPETLNALEKEFNGIKAPQIDESKFNLTPETGITPATSTTEKCPDEPAGGAVRPAATQSKNNDCNP